MGFDLVVGHREQLVSDETIYHRLCDFLGHYEVPGVGGFVRLIIARSMSCAATNSDP